MSALNHPPGLPESVAALASLAMREAGAAGYALFDRDAAGSLHRVSGGGIEISEEDLRGSAGKHMVTLRLDAGAAVVAEESHARGGLLAFVFDGAVTPAARSRLCPIAASIQQVWRISASAGRLTDLARRVGELEAQLADSRIAGRARGFLEAPVLERDVVELAARHVQNVLSRSESAEMLERRLAELEAEVEERQLADQAKVVLRKTEGLSEDAAHQKLRRISRTSRRPLREVAAEILAAGTNDRAALAGH